MKSNSGHTISAVSPCQLHFMLHVFIIQIIYTSNSSFNFTLNVSNPFFYLETTLTNACCKPVKIHNNNYFHECLSFSIHLGMIVLVKTEILQTDNFFLATGELM